MPYYYASEQNRREENQDSFCRMEIRLNQEAAVEVMAVADGMGGLSDGKFYSETAVRLWYRELVDFMLSETFRDQTLEQQTEGLILFSTEVLSSINSTLYNMGLNQGTWGGTTISTAIHFYNHWIIAGCGDSPVYIVRKGKVLLVSEIQNRANRLLDSGAISRDSEEYYKNKNKLMEYLGRREPVHPFCKLISDSHVDLLVVGSDGAFADFRNRDLEELITGCGDNAEMILPEMFRIGQGAGEDDNQTAILYVRESESPNSGTVQQAAEETDRTMTLTPQEKLENEGWCFPDDMSEYSDAAYRQLDPPKSDRKHRSGLFGRFR